MLYAEMYFLAREHESALVQVGNAAVTRKCVPPGCSRDALAYLLKRCFLPLICFYQVQAAQQIGGNVAFWHRSVLTYCQYRRELNGHTADCKAALEACIGLLQQVRWLENESMRTPS